MKAILLRIEMLLNTQFQEIIRQYEEQKKTESTERWLDSATVKLMLRVGDRTLYNHVHNKKLISEKRGLANFYLESSVLDLMEKQK